MSLGIADPSGWTEAELDEEFSTEYGLVRPSALAVHHIDEAITDTVRAVNESGWVWTTASCAGHEGNALGAFPYLLLLMEVSDLPLVLFTLKSVLGSYADAEVWNVRCRSRRASWVRVHLTVDKHVSADRVYHRKLFAAFAATLNRDVLLAEIERN